MNDEQWLDDQRAFAEAYLTGRVAGDRRRVKYRWWTTRSGRSGDVRSTLIGLLWSLVRGQRMSDDGVHVALFDLAAPVGERPFVTFDVPPETFETASGRSLGVVVGDAAPGGAFVLETRFDSVFPLWVPEAANESAPDWTEVESA